MKGGAHSHLRWQSSCGPFMHAKCGARATSLSGSHGDEGLNC